MRGGTIGRRRFMGGSAAGLLAAAAPWGRPSHAAGNGAEEEGDAVGGRLRPWRPGMLDIHHIATGRGDATLIVAPSGLAALVDAGAVETPDPAQVPPLPDGTRRPGEWIARYVRRRLAETGQAGLHAIMLTHLHPDHMGGIGARTPLHPGGAYRLTGISDVAGLVPVGRIVDPDYPDYGDPPFEDRPSAENYVNFVRAFAAGGGRVERLRVGRTGQVLPDGDAPHGAFAVRAVASRGRVWTGRGEDVREVFPPRGLLARADIPNENAASSAILVGYGAFRYFLAGDTTDWADAGTRPWLNALTPAARAAGRVDVAVLAHHGMYDAASSATVQALAARAWIVSVWHALHPSIDVLDRVLNRRLYPGARDVYVTALHPATAAAMPWQVRRLTGKPGHVVCRVAPGGRAYRIVVTDAAGEDDRVIYAGGPHAASPAGG